MIGLLRLGQRQSGRASLIANALGRSWTLVANIITFPIYLRLLGQENFGIVAVLASITAIVALFDFGLTPVFSRELHHQGRSFQSRIDLLRSAEVAILAIVALIAAATWSLPDGILAALVKAPASGSASIAYALRWVFTLAAAQLLFTFYVSVMSGIEAQVQSNLLSVGTSVLRSLGVIAPLLIWPTPDVFLLWQFVTTVIGVVAARTVLYGVLSVSQPAGRARFSVREIRAHLPAAGSSFLLATAATLNMNLDKIFVGKMGGLMQIAEYSIAATFAQLIFIASVPITVTVTPRMVRAITGNDPGGFARLLAITTGAIGVVTAMLVVIGFSHGATVIQYWSDGAVASDEASQYLGWLLMGSACLSFSAIYHCVATAHLDFSFGRPYILSMLLTVPSYWLAIEAYGVHGAAVAWGCAQLIIMAAYMLWVSRRHLFSLTASAIPVTGICVGVLASGGACLLLGQLHPRGIVTLAMLVLGEIALASLLAGALLAVLHRRFGVNDGLTSFADSTLRKLIKATHDK